MEHKNIDGNCGFINSGTNDDDGSAIVIRIMTVLMPIPLAGWFFIH